MNNLLKLIISAFVVFIAASCSFAQATATATATATIIVPITITKNMDMNFGNIAVSEMDGKVILSPESTRTPKGGVTLPRVNGPVAAASFNVTGMHNSTFSITLPGNTINLNYLANTMTANSFTSTPANTGTLVGGSQTVTIGATLNVEATQMRGSYASLAFPVTVNYN